LGKWWEHKNLLFVTGFCQRCERNMENATITPEAQIKEVNMEKAETTTEAHVVTL